MQQEEWLSAKLQQVQRVSAAVQSVEIPSLHHMDGLSDILHCLSPARPGCSFGGVLHQGQTAAACGQPWRRPCDRCHSCVCWTDMPGGAPASLRELTGLRTLSLVCCQLPELRLPEAMPGDTPGSLRLLTY